MKYEETDKTIRKKAGIIMKKKEGILDTCVNMVM